MLRRAKLAGLTLPLALGCGAAHTQTPAAPHDARGSAADAISGKALWRETEAWLALRPSLVGEPVLILVDEAPGAQPGSGFAQALRRSHPELGLADLLALLRATESRTQPDLALAVQVRRVLPDGSLFVEGTRVLSAAGDELHLYVSGIVQYEDLARDHSVRSSALNAAEIELVARGSHGAGQNRGPGWLQHVLQVAETR